MSRTAFIIFIALFCGMFVHVFPARGQEGDEEGRWTGTLKDGTVINVIDLKKILKEHRKLNEIDKDLGKAREENDYETTSRLIEKAQSTFRPVNLAGADLRKVDLSGTNLVGADLEGVNLAQADLSGTYLRGANLSNANLAGACLKGAHLGINSFGGLFFRSTILKGADLSGADLSEADLNYVDLSEAKLSGVRMNNTKISAANLTGSDLKNADLSGADLTSANLAEADLRSAKLNGAELTLTELWGADLSRASLQKAILEVANLFRTKLLSANLEEANLKNAQLTHTDLRLAYLANADFRGAAIFETNFSNSILYSTKFMGEGLLEMSLDGIMSRRDSERLNACYIMLTEWAALATEARFHSIIKSLYNLIFLELTGLWSLKSERPLIILICLIPYFAFFYVFALRTKNRKPGVWLILSSECVPEAPIKNRPFRLTSKFPPRTLPAGIFNKIRLQTTCWCRVVRISLYFSLLSAFNIGWREINAKNLITGMQRRDYALRATGWARSLAGIQSLLSIFLISLWLLTTFGHPF
jgi:uncharacterized protein YjbI with pentapeptide repeats